MVKPVLAVIGHTCAGKTTFGKYVSKQYGFTFVESSSIIQLFKHEFDKELDALALAKKLFASKGPEIVVKKILEQHRNDVNQGLIIAGLRQKEEIACLKKAIPQSIVVLVETSELRRYHYNIIRNRSDAATTLNDFRDVDFQQSCFGLLEVAYNIASICVLNEGTLQDYYSQIDRVIAKVLSKTDI